jgi:hypothetical protein
MVYTELTMTHNPYDLFHRCGFGCCASLNFCRLFALGYLPAFMSRSLASKFSFHQLIGASSLDRFFLFF